MRDTARFIAAVVINLSVSALAASPLTLGMLREGNGRLAWATFGVSMPSWPVLALVGVWLLRRPRARVPHRNGGKAATRFRDTLPRHLA